MNEQIEALHNKALAVAEKFHRVEIELIEILQIIDAKKVFANYGFSSLFDYAVRALKLSEANAYNFITVARKCRTVPELQLAIGSKHLSVACARKLAPVVTRENSAHWLHLASTLPRQKLEKEIAKVSPKSNTRERATYVGEARLQLQLGISDEDMARLKRAQDLVSQSTGKAASFEETLSQVLEFYLKRKDPQVIAKRNVAKKKKETQDYQIGSSCGMQIRNDIEPVPDRRAIPAEVKHQVHLRDQGRCMHVNQNNERCENRRWLEVHHIHPVSRGGGE